MPRKNEKRDWITVDTDADGKDIYICSKYNSYAFVVKRSLLKSLIKKLQRIEVKKNAT